MLGKVREFIKVKAETAENKDKKETAKEETPKDLLVSISI